jgi:hypothetical protein
VAKPASGSVGLTASPTCLKLEERLLTSPISI